MKKILCLFLCIFMLQGILSLEVSFAEPQQALNLTDYQREACETLQALNFLNADFDDEIILEKDKVTRAGFVDLVTNVYKNDIKSDTLYFYDIPKTHYAASKIAYLVEKGVINVNEERMFYPDNFITKTEAAKILCYLLGYDYLCKTQAWPSGVNSTAQRLKLYIGVGNNDEITFADAIVMLYNSLDVKYVERESKDTYNKTGETYLATYYDIYKDEGILSGYDGTSIIDEKVDDGYAVINGIRYSIEKFYPGELLGKSVSYYYYADKQSRKLIYARDRETSNSITLKKNENAVVYDAIASQIKYSDERGKVKTLNISKDASYIYNDVYKNSNIKAMFDNDFYEVTLIATNGSDYNVVIVKAYENYTVEGVDATQNRLYIKNCDNRVTASNPSGSYKTGALELSEYDKVEIIISSGVKGSVSELKRGMIISVFESENKQKLVIYASDKTVSGLIDKESSGDDIKYTIENVEYKPFKNGIVLKGVKVGSNIEVKLDYYGYIAYSGEMAKTANYTYLIRIVEEDAGFDPKYKLKMFTDENKMLTVELADKVKLDGNSISSTEAYIALGGSSMNPSLAVYKLDKEGKVSFLDVAESYSETMTKTADNMLVCTQEFSEQWLFENAMKFGPKLMAGSETAVFGVSPDVMDSSKDNYFVATTTSSLPKGDYYTIAGYTYGLDDRKECADVVVFKDESVILGSGTIQTKFLLIDEVMWALDKDGMEVKVLKGYNILGNLTEIKCSNDSSVNIPEVQRGDMVQINRFSGEYIADMKVLCGPSKPRNEWLVKKDYVDSNERETTGYVYDVVGNTIFIGFDNKQWDEVFSLKDKKIIVFDKEKDEVRLGSVEDIVPYVQNPDNYSSVFLDTLWGPVIYCVVYR